VAQAREFYDQAQKRLQTGDWAGYGESLNQLNDVIRRLEGLTQQ
jgi:flagellin-specific chaperone FliS